MKRTGSEALRHAGARVWGGLAGKALDNPVYVD